MTLLHETLGATASRRSRLVPALGLALALSGVGSIGPAFAQVVIPLAERPFKESLVGLPKVSGHVLVGLSLGESTGAFDAQAIALDLSPRFSDRRVCAQISSRDGRYWAENVYVLPKLQGSAGLEWGTRFGTELGRFARSDVAIVVRDVPDCLSSEFGSIVPVPTPGSDRTTLVAYVNPGTPRVKASLRGDGGEVATTSCTMIETGVRIAYSMRCVLSSPAPLAPGRYDLRLALRESTVETPIVFSVLIP